MGEPTLKEEAVFLKAQRFIQDLTKDNPGEDVVYLAIRTFEKKYEIKWFTKALELYLHKKQTPPGWDPRDVLFTSQMPLSMALEYIHRRMYEIAIMGKMEDLQALVFWKDIHVQGWRNLPDTIPNPKNFFEDAIHNLIIDAGSNPELNSRLATIHAAADQYVGEIDPQRARYIRGELNRLLGGLKARYENPATGTPKNQRIMARISQLNRAINIYRAAEDEKLKRNPKT